MAPSTPPFCPVPPRNWSRPRTARTVWAVWRSKLRSTASTRTRWPNCPGANARWSLCRWSWPCSSSSPHPSTFWTRLTRRWTFRTPKTLAKWSATISVRARSGGTLKNRIFYNFSKFSIFFLLFSSSDLLPKIFLGGFWSTCSNAHSLIIHWMIWLFYFIDFFPKKIFNHFCSVHRCVAQARLLRQCKCGVQSELSRRALGCDANREQALATGANQPFIPRIEWSLLSPC